MSLKQNDIYQENIWDEFQDALSKNDLETCERIIATTKAVGFGSLAKQLEDLLTDDVTFEEVEDPEPPVLEDGWIEQEPNDSRSFEKIKEDAERHDAYIYSQANI